MKKINFFDEKELSGILEEYNANSHRGFECGLKGVDEIVRFDKQTMAVVTARPSDGKSTFLNYYSFLMARRNDWKTLFISFETPIGKQVADMAAYYGNVCEVAAFCKMIDTTQINGLEDVYETLRQAKMRFGIDMAVIDTFTNLQGFFDVDTYQIGKVLTNLSTLSKELDICLVITAHSKKMQKGEKIDAYSICGSANFFNLSDYIISLEIIDRDNYITQVETLKIRDNFQKGINCRTAVLRFDPLTKRYSDASKEANDYPFELMAQTQRKDSLKERRTDEIAKKILNGYKRCQEAASEAIQRVDDGILNTTVSVYRFDRPKENQHIGDIPLSEALNLGISHKKDIDTLRTIDREHNETEYKRAKGNLPCFTVGCVCGETTSRIKTYNNLVSIDIDNKDNPHLELSHLKTKVNNLPWVLYSAASVGGKGLFAIVKIGGNLQEYKEHYAALVEEFENVGINVDKRCSNPNRLRYISYDEEPYFNSSAIIYKNKKVIQTYNNAAAFNGTALTKQEKKELDLAIQDIAARHLQITQGHQDTMSLACCFASLFGEDGRNLLHICRKQREGYNEANTNKNYDSALLYVASGHNYTLGTFYKFYNKVRAN